MLIDEQTKLTQESARLAIVRHLGSRDWLTSAMIRWLLKRDGYPVQRREFFGEFSNSDWLHNLLDTMVEDGVLEHDSFLAVINHYRLVRRVD